MNSRPAPRSSRAQGRGQAVGCIPIQWGGDKETWLALQWALCLSMIHNTNMFRKRKKGRKRHGIWSHWVSIVGRFRALWRERKRIYSCAPAPNPQGRLAPKEGQQHKLKLKRNKTKPTTTLPTPPLASAGSGQDKHMNEWPKKQMNGINKPFLTTGWSRL